MGERSSKPRVPHPSYPHAFANGRIADLEIPNRFVRSATAEDLTVYRERRIPASTFDLYRRLAASEYGLLFFAGPVSMPTSFARDGEFEAWVDGYAERRIEGVDAIPAVVRRTSPTTRIMAQSNVHVRERPSSLPSPYATQRPREMTVREIRELAGTFAVTIVRTQQEGFDGAQLHAGHGAILARFFSAYTNRRTDAYGGSIERRLRIAREIVDAARERVGAFPILIKVNGTDYVEGGTDKSTFPRIADELQRIGFDAIEVTGGMAECLVRSEAELGFRPVPAPESHTGIAGRVARQGYFLPYAKAVDVDVPLILTGGNRNIVRIEEILAEGAVDFVGLCRPTIREPELVDRWRREEGPEEAACLACNSCIYHLRVGSAHGIPYGPDVCPAAASAPLHADAQTWLADWVAHHRVGDAPGGRCCG